MNEKDLSIMIGILISVAVTLFWTFILTWQQIGFLKKDIKRISERNDEKNEEMQKEIFRIKYPNYKE